MIAEGLVMDLPVLLARHLPPGMGQAYRVLGDEIVVKATAAETGGAYALFEVRTPPGGRTPPHLQRYEDETCFVLDGSYTFLLGERTVELGPGGIAFAPRGTVHAFANRGDTPARLLLLVTPGGIHEQFLAAIGALASGPPGDPHDTWRYGMIAAKYGIELVAPPG